MLRSILAVVVGYIACAAVVMIGMPLVAKLTGVAMQETDPPTPPPNNFLTSMLTLNVLASAVGGVVLGAIASGSIVQHAAVLAAVMIVLGIFYLKSMAGKVANWYLYLFYPSMLAGLTIGAVIMS